MKINGINISEYKAELIDRQASTQVVKNITAWLDGSVEGTLLRQNYDYKTLKVTFVIRGETEDESYKLISKLTETLKKCTLVFDDINLSFPCLLGAAAVPERVQNSVFKISYVLLNDWAVGETVTIDFDLPQHNIQELKVKYVKNWAATTKGYAQCFDNMLEDLADETIYIDKDLVEESATAANTWVKFFLALGVDIDKYRPLDCINGFTSIVAVYDAQTAQNWMINHNELTIIYNKFQKEGYPDFPLNTTYPSLVWSVDDNADGYYFDLGIGNGWNIRDISFTIVGRWFHTGSNGSLIGAGSEDNYTLGLAMPNAKYYTGDINPKQAELFKATTSGSKIIIQTLEDIDDTPMRKYGFKSSNDSSTPINGYIDVICNGITIDRAIASEAVLTSNITLMLGKEAKGKYADIARVQVFHKGQLVKDIIPIAANIANGFVNTYDNGFYDINEMSFIEWTKANGNKGNKPLEVMPVPDGGVSPQPPAPPTPPAPPVVYYAVTVNGGSGGGQYEEGQSVTIVADAPPTGYRFKNWSVDTGNVTIATPTASSASFTMPAGDVTISAVNELIPIVPEILYYDSLSDANNETTMGANKGVWAASTYGDGGPAAYDNFVAVYSVPNTSGQWSVYNSTYYSNTGQGRDKWGRPYIQFSITTGKSKTGQYITYTPTGGTQCRQNFCIKSM